MHLNITPSVLKLKIMFKDLKYIFSPNKTVSKPTVLMIIGVQIVLLLLAWYATGELIPKPHEVLAALGNFFKEGDLVRELFVSTGLCLQAMGIAILISLAVSYLTVLPFFRPPAFLWSKGFVPRLETSLAMEVPNPLYISISKGTADIETVLKDVLALTKLNYNACVLKEA